MEELKKFQSSTFDTIARRRLVEDQDTILELSGRILELQNEINCMNDSRDFQDAESVRSGNSHVTSRPVSFPPHPIPEGKLSRAFGVPSRREGPPSIWDTHGISGNVFVSKSRCVVISNSSSRIESIEFKYIRKHSQPKIQSYSVEGTLRRIMEQTHNDCRFQIFISTNFPSPATFACWKIRFKTQVCTCSQFPAGAMHWIKEVEMVDSVDDFVIIKRYSNAEF